MEILITFLIICGWLVTFFIVGLISDFIEASIKSLFKKAVRQSIKISAKHGSGKQSPSEKAA